MIHSLDRRTRLLRFFALWSFAVWVIADAQSQETNETSFDTTPQEIPFQNDSQWEDNRWQAADVGPFLAGTIAIGKDKTLKGLAIRVGASSEAALCFDTARMRWSAAWVGGFLQFGSRRFGLTQPPASDGEILFTTDKTAGWAFDGRFKPTRREINGPAYDDDWEVEDKSECRLPRRWCHYRGHYLSNDRVVLSYTVGQTSVLESAWFVRSGSDQAFTRTLEIGGSTEPMQMWAAGGDTKVTVIGGDRHVTLHSNRPVLTVAARDDTVRVKVLITKADVPEDRIKQLIALTGPPENLSDMIRDDRGRYPDALLTEGEKASEQAAYVIDTITLPFKNPWNALLFTSGHDFFSDGTAAICTVHGDVWTVSGIDRELKELRWRRFATGLCQPLGLRIVDDKVHVIGRNQVTRLHDRNHDGEADYHENFNNDMLIRPRAHDFVTCLDTDPSGNFYFIHATTGVMKLSPDGSKLESVADGFRNPNGMGVSPEGMITAAPQQGTWTPESSLIVVRQGGYYGYGGPRITDERPAGWELPMCFIPRPMDNSGGGQVWVEGSRWGPLEGKMLHLSYGQCRMLLALTEPVDGTYQGGTIQFPTVPADFESGVMRGRFNPGDGQLYVSGLRGWQTRSVRDGCFQRVRYTGGSVHLPTAVKTYTNGVQLHFTEPLDETAASSPDNYYVQQWNYLWSEQYGSPQFSVQRPQEQGRDDVDVLSATVMDGGRSVFLEMPGRGVVHQMSLNWLLKSSPGESFRGNFAHTINRPPTETFPESAIKRVSRPELVPREVVDRLRPGLITRTRSRKPTRSSGAEQIAEQIDEQIDVRTARLVAMHQRLEEPPTPMLPAGPFETEWTGTMRVPRSGLYDFKIEGSGEATVLINDKPVVSLSDAPQTGEPVLLRKGHNRLNIAYHSPDVGVASLRLLWRGFDFGWEPVPPGTLFHDDGDPQLTQSRHRRLGRELFADHRCASCHAVSLGPQPMFELTLPAPDLDGVGRRLTESWLSRWMIAPGSLRPVTHMPAVLGRGDRARQAAADIAAFLATNNRPAATVSEDHRDGNDGETLFETLGCIACHHFEEPSEDEPFDRLSLHFVDAKFQDGALATFLMNPSAHDVGTEMPDFRLSKNEAMSLARYVRDSSRGTIEDPVPSGDPQRGAALYRESGCQQCHRAGPELPAEPKRIPMTNLDSGSGCLSLSNASARKSPEISLSPPERDAVIDVLENAMQSLSVADPRETAARLVKRLRCASCHDRDGQQSHRPLVIAQEGSGRLPETIPSLTWAGEKLRSDWMIQLMSGELVEKSRPWLAARMPAFAAYAKPLADGLARQHGIDPAESAVDDAGDSDLVEAGKALTLQNGLDCRQCHAIGDLQPRGDKDTKIALGINFAHIRDRMRHDAYHRFMLDPPRYDVNTRMIKLSENGLTTKLKTYFDANAQKQFEAVWSYIQSLPR